MIKYATAIRTRTASTEAILRRFTRNASHPTYAAMLEVGRAQKTIFVARYLRLRDLQREIDEGLNVVESWNGANGVLAYGKGGDIADQPPRRAGAVRAVPADPAGRAGVRQHPDAARHPRRARLGRLLTPADRRGLTPLFWMHVLPYGEVNLDMTSRLAIGSVTPDTP